MWKSWGTQKGKEYESESQNWSKQAGPMGVGCIEMHVKHLKRFVKRVRLEVVVERDILSYHQMVIDQ